MKYLLKISLVLIAIILTISTLILLNKNITGNSVSEFYTYTKAICDENICQDYYIICNENKLIDKSPITGSSIKNINKIINNTENLCN